MSEPDDLYTLRALFWLGHYQMALDEAKKIARRPMSMELKAEREEFIQRATLALGQPVIGGDTNALKALAITYKYSQAATSDAKSAAIDEMKTVLASDGSTSVQLFAAQLFLTHGLTKDALQCVHHANSMEQAAMCVQIHLKLDRIDLATKSLNYLRHIDEDAVLTSLSAVHIALAGGRSTASDTHHSLNSLSEQYGPSPLLLNLMACSYCTQGEYVEAETRLLECKKEFELPNADTLINLIVCSQFLNKDTSSYVAELKEGFPTHPYCEALTRVEGAFDRESLKYRVKA